MSVINEKISTAKSLIPAGINLPLDARTVCDSVNDFPNIELPYLGMIIFTGSDQKYWKVTKLKEKIIGTMPIANAQIAEYEPFGNGSGGADFSTGTGIKISESGEISVDTEVIATKAEIGDIAAVLDAINGEEV